MIARLELVEAIDNDKSSYWYDVMRSSVYQFAIAMLG